MAKEDRKNKDEEQQQQEAPPPKSKKKLIIIIAAVVVLLLVVAGVVLMSGGKKTPAHGDAEGPQEATKHFVTFDLEPMVVNLSEIGTFIKVALTIEYDPELLAAATSHGAGGGGGYGGGGSGGGGEGGKGGTPAVFIQRGSQITDAIIRTISAKKASDLLSRAGKEALKDELIEVINEALGLDEAPVVNIYFKEFIIQ